MDDEEAVDKLKEIQLMNWKNPVDKMKEIPMIQNSASSANVLQIDWLID